MIKNNKKNIILFVILMVASFLMLNLLINFLFAFVDLPKSKFTDTFYLFMRILTNISLIITIISILYKEYKIVYYNFITGRNYENDKKYNCSYSYLLNYFKNAEPYKLTLNNFPTKKWYDSDGLVFGINGKKVITLPADCESNIVVIGPPGAGKTSGIVIPTAMCYKGSTFVIDIKNDIYNYVSTHSNRKIIVFTPDAPDALYKSAGFDPFQNINQMNDSQLKTYIEFMSLILISENGKDEDNYFIESARTFFKGGVHYLLHQNPNIGFPEVIRYFFRSTIFSLTKEAINSDCEIAKDYLSSFIGNNEKNVTGAYNTLIRALNPYNSHVLNRLLARNIIGSNNSVPYISIDALEAGYDVYLQISPENLSVYAPLFTLITQTFSSAFMKRPDSSTGVKNRPILMILDEFPQLTFSQQLISSNLATLRSKSINIMLIQQNLSQLEAKYGINGARSILGNCNTWVILGSNDINSSNVFSEMFGNKKALAFSTSHTLNKEYTSSVSVHETTERVFPPEFFGELVSRPSLVFSHKGHYAEIDQINCYKDY